MIEFIVGKEYVGTLFQYKCLFVHEDGVLLQQNGSAPSFWSIADASRNLSLYVPPPKKVKKTGWVNIYTKPNGDRILGALWDTKEGALSAYGLGDRKIVEITWEEEVPGDDDAYDS